VRLSCPACQAETSLEGLMGREADARAVAGFIERNVAFGELMVRYIALFRPPKRRLGIARTVALIEELLPDIQRGAVNRKGRDWAAPRDAWREALETVLIKRDREALNLPLTSHGLLLEILVGLAERYESKAERQREDERRSQRQAGPRAEGPRDFTSIAAEITTPVAALPAATQQLYATPSRAALAAQEQIKRHQRRRAGANGNEPGDGTTQEQP